MFNGAGVAVVTPFKDGKFDSESYEKLIDLHLENSTQALIVLGTTGESSTISFEEREEIISLAVKRVNKKIPVIIGVGSNSTEITIKNTLQAERLDADGTLIATPYYNKATQNGLIQHYKKIAEASDLPLILYNVPSRTGLNMEASTVYELSKVDNIVGIKEASGDISQVLEIKRLVDKNFKIYSGNDDQIIAVYGCGGHGVISVVANVLPKQTQEMCSLFEKGKIKEALDLQLKYKKFIDLLFTEVNPIPVKAALKEMGLIENELRLPLTSMETANQDILMAEMKEIGLI